ncbi:MAG: ABC transporter ATP-binding protein/permease [Candidatus Cloacimonetes bacterium]|nr:ABC transporter ATP-binding protein/permease [Candidatus Cloacimonadota bacterium]MCF7815168.1 ABC transporter ATP-binding protein/permease [Candidatus Cloacimonadota bacterium]MCF7869374.1 ABC transporter ATP-binding protein/permease [Candidatus Cloacimonadota bacterium]MCF7884776.1 ABC transporter ATP-binding protein/permease [Candidatus Cloacimonadota bacterium]
MKTFEKVFPFVKKNIPILIGGIILIILIDAGQLFTINIMQRAIDSMSQEGFTKQTLLYSALWIAGITITITILRYFWRLAFVGTAWTMDRDIRQMYYDHLLKLSANFFHKTKTGDLMAYATNDMNAVRMLFAFGFVIGCDILVIAIASLFFMVNISLKLTLLAVIPTPILSIVIMVFGRQIHHRFRKVQKTFAELSGKVQESISGIRVVKAFVQEESELEKMSESAMDYVNDNIRLVKIHAMFHPMMFLIINMCMGIILVFGGEAAILNDISIGEFVAFFQYLGMLVWPMIAIGWIVNLFQRGTASLKRLNSIFEQDPEIFDEDIDPEIKILHGAIRFQNLSFNYKEGSAVILDDISFQIEAGKTLAIVGKTGCGKSTIIELLTRVYNPPANSVFIDEHELFKIPLNTLRNNIVMVPQEIFLFSDTVANNIKLGKADADMEEVIEVTKKAQVYDSILEFDKGFDTMVGERGVTLSGGQKQRLAIARALLTNPNILVLDDALSAVDTKTEKNILDDLINLRKNKTTIIISHRISSIQHADKIIVLNNAKIEEEGSHEELLQDCGIYRDLYEKQQIEEKLS